MPITAYSWPMTIKDPLYLSCQLDSNLKRYLSLRLSFIVESIPDHDEQCEQHKGGGGSPRGGGAGAGLPQVRGGDRGAGHEGGGRLLARVTLHLLRLWHQAQGYKGKDPDNSKKGSQDGLLLKKNFLNLPHK